MKFKYLFHYKFIYDATFNFSSLPDAGARNRVPGKIAGELPSDVICQLFHKSVSCWLFFLFRLIFIFSHANPRTIV